MPRSATTWSATSRLIGALPGPTTGSSSTAPIRMGTSPAVGKTTGNSCPKRQPRCAHLTRSDQQLACSHRVEVTLAETQVDHPRQAVRVGHGQRFGVLVDAHIEPTRADHVADLGTLP